MTLSLLKVTEEFERKQKTSSLNPILIQLAIDSSFWVLLLVWFLLNILVK